MTAKFTRRRVIVAGAAAGVAGVLARPAVAAATGSTARGPGGTAFTHVTIINPHSGKVMPDMTVVVRGDKITDVGPSGQVQVSRGTTVVDLRDKFLIPGLADMHTHAQAEGIDTGLYVANGVTTVREMAGSPLAHDWRSRIDAGTLLGPRFTIGSRLIDGAPSIWNPEYLDILQVADATQARQAVRQVVADGADFAKVYSRLSPSAYRALAAESHRLGVPFAGHCPDEVPIAEAADLGQASVEHLFWTPFGTSSNEAQIRAQIAKIRLELGNYSGWFKAIQPLEWSAAHTYSPVKARRVFDKLARRRTRQVPTLTMHYGLDNARTLPEDDPRNKYLPASALAGQQLARQEFYLKDRDPAEDAEWAAMFEYRLRTVGELHRAGVPIMTGVDSATLGVYPGFSVHDELGYLVDAGLSPMAALYAATVEPATFLGANTGRVATSYAADLVVLDANPLHDIANTKKLSGVVVRGRYLGPDERLRILAEVAEAAANEPAGVVAAGCPCHAPRPTGLPSTAP
jgi:imidazolonepropionase-like amidohydrolase